MSSWQAVWLARSKWWAPALAFFLLNLSLLLAYRLTVSVRIGAQRSDLAAIERQAAAVAAERRDLELALARAERTRGGIAVLKQQQLGPLEQRLTATMARVKELTRTAGLQGPSAISYPEEEVEGFGLVRKAFVFTVSGSYQDLRELINLLELSDAFLVLERVELKGGSPGNLEIQLRLSTLFLSPEGPRRKSA